MERELIRMLRIVSKPERKCMHFVLYGQTDRHRLEHLVLHSI